MLKFYCTIDLKERSNNLGYASLVTEIHAKQSYYIKKTTIMTRRYNAWTKIIDNYLCMLYLYVPQVSFKSGMFSS